MDIQSMRSDYPQAVARARQAVETAHNEVAGIVAGLEQAPINPASKDAWREFAGMLASLPTRVDDADGATRASDEEFWRELADGGRPNPQAWGS